MAETTDTDVRATWESELEIRSLELDSSSGDIKVRSCARLVA